MKKLMIVACVIAMATVAQAYSIKWGSGTLQSAAGTTGTAKNITVTLVNITADEYAGLVSTYSGSEYSSGNKISTDLYETYAKDTAVAGVTTTASKGALTSAESTDYAAGESSYKVIIYTSEDGDGNLNYIANVGVVTIDADSPKNNSASNMGSKYFGEKNKTMSWQAVPTPEPTSGLLLLLGMGALALRRKQK